MSECFVIQLFLEGKVANLLLHKILELTSLSMLVTLEGIKRKETTASPSNSPLSCK
jgi:hypothetical protein